MAAQRRLGACPLCGLRIPTPSAFDGTWTGAKRGGGPAGGVSYHARCRPCRAPLAAYCDSYDDHVHVIAAPESGVEPAPAWTLRGVPWQTIGLVVLAVASVLWYALRVGGRLWRESSRISTLSLYRLLMAPSTEEEGCPPCPRWGIFAEKAPRKV